MDRVLSSLVAGVPPLSLVEFLEGAESVFAG